MASKPPLRTSIMQRPSTTQQLNRSSDKRKDTTDDDGRDVKDTTYRSTRKTRTRDQDVVWS